jgi:RNA recognition motif-containing protein
MAIKLFVAGLSYAMTDNDLRDLFAPFGSVASAQIVTDRDTRQSKGFGFVELSTEAEGKAAIAELNGKDMDGRPLTVNVARPREERPARSFQDRDRRNTTNNSNNRRRPRY